MSRPDLDQLEELEERIVPLLKRRGIDVQEIQPIGLLGSGASSSVFSLLLNDKYHVLKVYNNSQAYQTEIKNRKKLLWPPKVVMSSRRTENSLGLDLLLTESPPGREFCSDDLRDWVMEALGQTLLDLHRVKRTRKVKTELNLSRLERARDRALGTVQQLLPDEYPAVAQIYQDTIAYYKKHEASFRVKRSLIHGDLWWSNIIVAKDEVYLIDWEALKTGDYLDDIGHFRIMLDYTHYHEAQKSFWRSTRRPDVADRFFQGIIDLYKTEMPDPNIELRLKFFLVQWCFIQLKEINARIGKFPVEERAQHMVEDLKRYWKYNLAGGSAD